MKILWRCFLILLLIIFCFGTFENIVWSFALSTSPLWTIIKYAWLNWPYLILILTILFTLLKWRSLSLILLIILAPNYIIYFIQTYMTLFASGIVVFPYAWGIHMNFIMFPEAACSLLVVVLGFIIIGMNIQRWFNDQYGQR